LSESSHWFVPPCSCFGLGGDAAGRTGTGFAGPALPAGLLTAGGALFAAIFSFLAFCIQSGQVTSLAFAD
jgi:hypothetical protein